VRVLFTWAASAGWTTAPGNWLVIEHDWRPGDRVDVSLPMTLALKPTPDDPAVQAATYGPVVLSGGYGALAAMPMPRLSTGSLALTSQQPLTFQARAGEATVALIPLARMHHQHYNVYWRT